MSNEMVERVGNAIAHKVNYETFELGGGLKRAVARAAIEAMMEPTEAMGLAGFRVNKWENKAPCGEPHCVGRVSLSPVAAYTAMIQAALKEEE